MEIETVLDRLEKVKRMAPGQWTALCPVHDDKARSLAISTGREGKVLMHCFAGCSFAEISQVLDLPKSVRMRVPGRARRAKRIIGEPNSKDFGKLNREYQSVLQAEEVEQVGLSLGISPEALHRLEMGVGGHSLTFPMRDANDRVIGIRTRTPDGSKKAITGSKAGIFWPRGVDQASDEYIFMIEGPTDTGVMLDLGFDCIGRPSATGGGEVIWEWLAKCPRRRWVVIVADRDEPKQKMSGEIWYPGLDGARRLRDKIDGVAASITIIQPIQQFKDIRQWHNEGYLSADAVMSLVANCELNPAGKNYW